MRILLIGNTGRLGSKVQTVLEERGHEVVEASRSHPEHPVDIGTPESIARLYDTVGAVDAVACAAGHVVYDRVHALSYESYRESLLNKALGQIELVRRGISVVPERGSFTLITGVLAKEPVVTSSAASAANGAVEAFVRAAALEIAPQRVNAVSPTVFAESMKTVGHLFPGEEPIPVRNVANAYVRSIERAETGRIFQLP
ncbi:short chain dehydrogenase [Parasphingorhabdus pacifica]